ncbi:MAG: hypothetical protein LUE92_16050, partial [Clostridiales bacterium]|nr:hypothetical protein [Clostridiales bacterium]
WPYTGICICGCFCRTCSISLTEDDQKIIDQADLMACQKFERKVPIYLPDGGYVESLGFKAVRKSVNPPWQSSVRPLSKAALEFIIRNAGTLQAIESVENLKDELKRSVQNFYVGGRNESALEILDVAQRLCQMLGLK